jgi:hypothetical protein
MLRMHVAVRDVIFAPSQRANDSTDPHFGNITFASPSLNGHSVNRILNYFGNPECTPVGATKHVGPREVFTEYLGPAIPMVNYMVHAVQVTSNIPLCMKMIDFRNGLSLIHARTLTARVS